MRIVLSLAPIFLLLVFTGCTSHYRKALLEYRQGEPLPFYQRTLHWLTDADATPAPMPPVIEPAGDAITPADLPAPEDKHLQVAAKVLAVTSEWLAERWPLPLESASTSADVSGALSNRLDFDELLIAVAAMSPEVTAARQEWRAMLNQYGQAEFLEGLLREYRTFTRYLDVGAGDPMNKEMLQESFPSPSTITYRGEMVREEVRLAELEWERVLRDALIEAGMLFFDYQFQHRGTATVTENVSLLDNLIEVVQDRYATGLASQADVLRLQAELERQRNLLLEFQSRMVADAAQINGILGREANAPLGPPDDNDVHYRISSHEALMELARANRQEILAQEVRVARTAIAIRMGELMNRPLFSQGYSTLDRGMMPETGVVPSPGAPASMADAEPLPFAARADQTGPRPAYAQSEAYLAEIRQRLAAEQAMLEQTIATTGALAKTLLEQAEIAHRQVTLVRDVVLPLSQSTYEIALRAYTTGDMGFVDLLDTERELIEARLELDESRRDQNVALIRLASARGFLSNATP